MPWKLTIRAAELLVTAVLAACLFAAWRAERNDRAQLSAQLATAKQSLTQADDRQHTRDSQLLQTLATLAADKRTTTTPDQIIRELPQQLGLPLPITLQPVAKNPTDARPDLPAPKSGSLPNPGSNVANSTNLETQQTQAIIPAADLKPLYDFTIDCKACQAKLATAQANLSDEKVKTATLTKQRDEAIRAAKGGSLLHRIARAAKWFAISAAAGAVVARAAH